MKIDVIANHVPDSRAAIRVAPDGSRIDVEGVKHSCDPFDEIGLEQAVRLKAQRKDVEEVVVVAIGGAGVVETLRHGLAMGADRAVHISDDRIAHHQEMTMAFILSAAIRRLGLLSGLILCGARTTDSGAGAFGPALAEYLGIPHAGAATKLEVAADGGSLRAHCRVEGGELVLEMTTPALITCERGLAEPQQPALPKLMKAKKMPVETLRADELGELPGLDATLRRLQPPPARPSCRMLAGDAAQMARELARVLREEARVL